MVISNTPPGEGNFSGNCNNTNSTGDASITSFQNVMMFLTITAIFGALVQGVAPKRLLKAVPQPVVVMVCYLIAGVVARVVSPDAVQVGVSRMVDPLAIQALFLPVLMFSELFRLNTRAFFIVQYQLLLLVGPGVIMGAVLTALFPTYIMPSRPLFDFDLGMAFGGMLSTTDPIAIIICVNELAAPKRLAAVVGGESLLNDGTSIVLVTLFLQLRGTGPINAGAIVFFVFNQLLFSVLFGIGVGILSLLFIRMVRDDSSTLISFVIAVPFLTYVVASYFFNTSGVLSIIPLGVILNEFGRGMMMEHVERIERLFDQLSFIATNWLYGLSGFVVGEVIASSEIHAVDWGSLFILYVWINFVRFVMVFCAYPFLKYTGYGFSIPEAILLAYGGLRGAVGLTLALSIKESLAEEDPRQASLIEFFMAGSIFLMIFNGITAPMLLRRLGLASKPNDQVMEALQQKMAEQCVDALERAGVDYNLAHFLAHGTDQDEVKMSRRKFTISNQVSQNDVAGSRQTTFTLSKGDKPANSNIKYVLHLLTKERVALPVLIEQRKHLIKAQRVMYEQLLTRGLLSRGAWRMLDRAADAQLEENHFHLNQFKYLVAQVFASKGFRLAVLFKCEFYHSTPGKLLLFLQNYGIKDIDEFMIDGSHVNHIPPRSAQFGAMFVDGANNTTARHSRGFDVENQNGSAGITGKFGSLRSVASLSQSVRRRRLLKRKKMEEAAADDVSEHWFPGFREMGRRATGVSLSPEEWLYNFTLASWGFILAQQDSIKLVDEMLTVTSGVEAFPNERRALKTEILENCALPAKFIDAVAKYYPLVLTKIKRLHALSESRNRLFGSVASLNAHGLLERHEIKRLARFAEMGLQRIQACDFELQPPTVVGDKAALLRENPNFFPFPRPTQLRGLPVTTPEEEDFGARSEEIPPVELMSAARQVSKDELKSRSPPLLERRQSSRKMRRFALRRAQSRIIPRRRSFSDFNPLKHELEDGSSEPMFWLEKKQSIPMIPPPELEDAQEIMEDGTLELLIDKIGSLDVSKIMDVLKLDDSTLKRY